MTFLGSGSLVFSVPRELFLTKKIQDQKNMPQIILKGRTPQTHDVNLTYIRRSEDIQDDFRKSDVCSIYVLSLGNSSFSQLLLQEILITIKTCHFHSSVNHQDPLFLITHITSYFHLVNIAKFLRTAFLQSASRSSCFKMFFRRCFSKQVFLEVSQTKQESTCVGVNF